MGILNIICTVIYVLQVCVYLYRPSFTDVCFVYFLPGDLYLGLG